MVAHIIFPANERRKEINIRKPNAVRIESGWEMLTDTATIVMARNVRYFDKSKVKDVFKRGDEVIIQLGYNGNLKTEFKGYVTRVSADIPIKIECEDAMYLLKKVPVNTSLKQTNVADLIKKIVPSNFKIDVLDVSIGTKRFKKTTVAKVLEYLQEEYNIYSYIKNFNTLVVGKVYSDDDIEVNYEFNKNVIDNKLKYRSKDEIQIKIEAVSTLKNGEKIEVTVGDEDGEVRRLSYYDIKVEAEIKRLAIIDYDKFKIDGFKGDITTWGVPSVTHGTKANLKSPRYPDRNGTYYIKHVTKIFDDSPKYHQILKLDKRAA